jgi:hypothetical protein
MEAGGANGGQEPGTPEPEFRRWWEEEGSPLTSRRSAAHAGWSRSKTAYVADDVDGEGPGAEVGKWFFPRTRAGVRGAYGSWYTRLQGVRHRRWRDFSWLAAGPLLDSINDQIAKVIHDLVNDRRQRWIAAQRAAGKADRDFVCDAPAGTKQFLILGDPGEIDGSQYSVVDPLLAVHRERGSDFMLVLSDVIYPAGDVNDYVNGFYIPYQEYDRPIYALPGNHDWYDGLVGFMFHFCGAEALPEQAFRGSSYTAPERVAGWLWRKSARPDRTQLLAHRFGRLEHDRGSFEAVQPAPYFALDIGEDLRLISIDTGIRGTIDREQGEWLVRVSDDPTRVKVLMTGKPLWVDGEYHPCPIEWGTRRENPPYDDLAQSPGRYPGGYETVDDVVRDPRNGYVASIGGDIHNYQRYSITVREDPDEPRPIEYVVSGGGGAYMSATHRFGKVEHTDREQPEDRSRRLRDQQLGKRNPERKIQPPRTVDDVYEEHFRCYPTRGDSLSFYARWFGRRVAYATGIAAAGTAAALVALSTWNEKADKGIHGHSVWGAFDAGLGGFAALILLAMIIGLVAWLMPVGFKFAVTMLTLPAAILGVVALADLVVADTAWGWVWPTALYTLGVALLPLLAVLAVYYGLASSGKPAEELYLLRSLAIGILILVEAIAWIPTHVYDSVTDLAVAIPAALGALALFVLVVALLRPQLSWLGHYIAPRWWLNIPFTLTAYGALVVFPLVRFQDEWQIQTVIVGALTFWVFVSGFFALVLIASGGVLALPWLPFGRLDPAEAHRNLVARGLGVETDQRRIATDQRPGTRLMSLFLMSPVVRHAISEAGNADAPPMFKNFLHAELHGEGRSKKLKLTCYGVTGWAAHQSPLANLPVEDVFELELGDALRKLLALRAADEMAAAQSAAGTPPAE